MINKICFFTNKIYLSGGAERVICTLASDFAEQGIDTTIITQDGTECGYPLHPAVKVLATKAKSNLPGVRFLERCLRLRKLLKSISPDAAISFMTDYNLILATVGLGLSCARIGSDRIYPGIIHGVRKGLCRLLYPFADGFVFQTDQARLCFAGRVSERAAVIKNPLLNDIPERAQFVNNKVVTVGRLTKQKNHALLLRAFCAFSKTHDKYELQIYGQGELRQELEALVGELGLTGKVFFMGTTDRVLQEIADAKMFVLSSDFEGMPNVLAEAMAIGLPCVSTDCLGGGAAALIRDGVNGRLVPIGDERALASAMSELAEDEAAARRFGEAAQTVREELSVRKISDQWLTYIQQVIDLKRGERGYEKR